MMLYPNKHDPLGLARYIAHIVARNAKEGNGTNGMSERKKLTNARPTYPTWGENGSSVVTSITCEHACQLFNHGRHEFGGC